MDLSDDGWKPPNGEYDVSIENVVTGVKEKNGVNNAWVRVTFSIMDGEFGGRSFTDFYYIMGGGIKEPTIAMKNLCRLATCISGSETRLPVEAAAIVEGATGEFLTLEVFRVTSRKDGKVHSNVRFLRRLESTET
jgi:hypothetical protein